MSLPSFINSLKVARLNLKYDGNDLLLSFFQHKEICKSTTFKPTKGKVRNPTSKIWGVCASNFTLCLLVSSIY